MKVHQPLKYLKIETQNLDNLPMVENLKVITEHNVELEGDNPKYLFTNLQYRLKRFCHLEVIFYHYFSNIPPST